MPCQVKEWRCSSSGGWGHTGWCHRRCDPCHVRCSSGGGLDHTGWCHRRCDPCHVRWRSGGAAVVEGGATRGRVTGGVTHAMPGGGGEVQQWWRVGPHGVVS